jgi:hypothetical protein
VYTYEKGVPRSTMAGLDHLTLEAS